MNCWKMQARPGWFPTCLLYTSCGEHPQAADSVGINVYKMRYAGVVISGALGAIGGMAYICLLYTSR